MPLLWNLSHPKHANQERLFFASGLSARVVAIALFQFAPATDSSSDSAYCCQKLMVQTILLQKYATQEQL